MSERLVDAVLALYAQGGSAAVSVTAVWAQRKALNAPLFATLRDWWTQHAQAGELRPLARALIHALWFGAARDLCDLWLGDPRVGSLADHAEVLGDAAWRAVAADSRLTAS